MKTLRLIIGITSMVLVLLIMFQSCAAGLSNLMAKSDEGSGFAGFVLSICFLIAGAIGVATHKQGGGGAIASIIFYTLGGIIGSAYYGTFADLKIWANLGYIFAGLYFLSVVFNGKKKVIPAQKEE